MARFFVVGRASSSDHFKTEEVEAEDALDAVGGATGFERLEIVPGCDQVDGVTIVRVLDVARPFLLFVLNRDARD